MHIIPKTEDEILAWSHFAGPAHRRRRIWEIAKMLGLAEEGEQDQNSLSLTELGSLGITFSDEFLDFVAELVGCQHLAVEELIENGTPQ
jgi:hypothetical protein